MGMDHLQHYNEHKYECQNCSKRLFTDAGGWHTITVELHEDPVVLYVCPKSQHGEHRPMILGEDPDTNLGKEYKF